MTRRIWKTLLPVILILVLAACTGPTASSITPTAAVESTASTPDALPTPTAEPSPTAQSGKLVLASPAGMDVQDLQAVLANAAGQAGLTVETRGDLEAADLTPNVKVVVLAGAPANLNDLLAAGQHAQFIVVSDAELNAVGNLSVIRRRAEHQAFLGGFISVLLSTDWRAAGLLPNDDPLGEKLAEAYRNGGSYFCGVCAPGWPLGVTYPQVGAQPSATDGPTWQAAAAGLFDAQKVEAYFLSAEAAKPEVINYLRGLQQFGADVLVVGVQPPPDALAAQWAATVSFDTAGALEQILPGVLSGTGGAQVEAPLMLEHVNEDNLGDGRIRLVEELLAEIAAGRIHPFTVPLE